MSIESPIILITPEAQAALKAEGERTSISGDLAGGLLFGYPLDERHRLVVNSVWLRSEVGFGERNFCLDQSRTSQQLEHARKLAAEASYCGVWYLHRTPNRELTDEEWVQTQSVLEDPDFRFKDLVCLVLCFYSGELKIYASSFNRYHSVRGQFPEPTVLQLTTSSLPTPARASPAQPPAPTPAQPPAPSPAPTAWYKSPNVARRLKLEHERLAQKYHVEAALAHNEQMTFRLMPKGEYGNLTLYLVCEPGFPDKAPVTFLSAGGKQYPLLSPGLSNWSAGQSLVEVVGDLLEQLPRSLDQYVTTAEETLNRGDHQEAADLLTVVLSIDPRTPRAARLLARAQAPLG